MQFQKEEATNQREDVGFGCQGALKGDTGGMKCSQGLLHEWTGVRSSRIEKINLFFFLSQRAHLQNLYLSDLRGLTCKFSFLLFIRSSSAN